METITDDYKTGNEWDEIDITGVAQEFMYFWKIWNSDNMCEKEQGPYERGVNRGTNNYEIEKGYKKKVCSGKVFWMGPKGIFYC